MNNLPIEYDLKFVTNGLDNWILLSNTKINKNTIYNLILYSRESAINFENTHVEFIANYFKSKKSENSKYSYTDLENDTSYLFSDTKFSIDKLGFFYFRVGNIQFKYRFSIYQSIRELKIKKVLNS